MRRFPWLRGLFSFRVRSIGKSTGEWGNHLQRTALWEHASRERHQSHSAAWPDALRCDVRCSALRWASQRTASIDLINCSVKRSTDGGSLQPLCILRKPFWSACPMLPACQLLSSVIGLLALSLIPRCLLQTNRSPIPRLGERGFCVAFALLALCLRFYPAGRGVE